MHWVFDLIWSTPISFLQSLVTMSSTGATTSTEPIFLTEDGCAICGKKASQLCGQCQASRYCSKECQQTDWNLTSFSAAPTRISRFDPAKIRDLLFSYIPRRRSRTSSGSSAPRTSWERRMNLIMSKSPLATSLPGPSNLV
jgi:hypothetical protein